MLNNLRHKLYRLLRYSEKYTQTDMVYLAKGGFWLTFGQSIAMISSFLLAIAFANLLPKEVYGQYKYILSILGILLLSNVGGINTAFTRAVARGFEASMFKYLKIKLKWSLLGALASLVLALYYYINNNIILGTAFLITTPFIIIFDNFAIYNSYLHGKKRFDKLTKYNSFLKIVSLIIIVLVAYLSNNVYFLLLALFVPQTILHIIFLLREKSKNIFNKKEDADTINYGKKLSFINIISVTANQLDKVLIFHYLGAVELAVYAFAMAPPEQIKNLIKSVQSLAFPKFAQKTREEIKQSIFKKSLKLSIVMAFIIIVYILLAPLFFKIFFPAYMDAVIYSQILSLSLVALPIWIFQSAFKAQKMTKQILHLELINGIFQIILTFLLISNFGLWGAVIARTLYRIVNLTMSAILFKKA